MGRQDKIHICCNENIYRTLFYNWVYLSVNDVISGSVTNQKPSGRAPLWII